MTHISKQFTVADPRTFEGNPFEVAGRSVAQLAGIVDQAASTLDATKVMARNATLERQLYAGEDPDAIGWPDTAEGRYWSGVEANLSNIQAALKPLQKLAEYNPKHPPKA